ncbi:hypothetical protein [Promicromonospora panici]|nr:hypothetical protein [Promicromonospora panici]
MDTAQQAVLLGSVDEALRDVQDQVQPQMEQYCPYALPSDCRQGARTR